MWPRRCRRGRLHPSRPKGTGNIRLQCGHGDVAVEDFRTGQLRRSSTSVRFNVATAMSPWKTRRPSVPDEPAPKASMCHGDVAVENDALKPKNVVNDFASMWPRRCRRGRRRAGL